MVALLAAISFVTAHAAVRADGCAGLGASCTLTLGFTASAGNDLVIGIAYDGSCTVSSVTDSGGNTYSLLGTTTNNAVCAENNQIRSSHLGASATTVTVNFSASCSSEFTILSATEYSGVATIGNTPAGSTGNSGTTSATVTLQNAANWAFGAFQVCVNSGTYTATSGTIRVQGAGPTEGTACSIDNSAGGTVTATSSMAGQWVANVVELCATNPCSGTATATPSRTLTGVGQ